MSEGGFGGLGIGNPGSYGGQQTVGAPGFSGGYSRSASSPWHTSVTNAWNKIKGKLPAFGAGLMGALLTGGNPLTGLLAYKVTNNIVNSDIFKNLGDSQYSEAPDALNQLAAKQLGVDPSVFKTIPTRPELVNSFIDSQSDGLVLGPDRLDAENTVNHWLSNPQDRGTREDPTAQGVIEQIGFLSDPTNYEGTGGTKTNWSGQPTTLPPEAPGTGDGAPMGTTPFTLTLADLVNDPRYGMYKDASQQNFQTSRDNIMSFMPQGGQLLDRLAGLESDKASFMTNALGTLSQDIADKSYGKDLAEMGANVTLQGYNTQKDIAADSEMNDMLTMIGYGLASK